MDRALSLVHGFLWEAKGSGPVLLLDQELKDGQQGHRLSGTGDFCGLGLQYAWYTKSDLHRSTTSRAANPNYMVTGANKIDTQTGDLCQSLFSVYYDDVLEP